jgi:hypothetical protein
MRRIPLAAAAAAIIMLPIAGLAQQAPSPGGPPAATVGMSPSTSPPAAETTGVIPNDVVPQQGGPLDPQTPTGLDKVADDGISTKNVKAVPCSTAARETDGTTTCVGIPDRRR